VKTATKPRDTYMADILMTSFLKISFSRIALVHGTTIVCYYVLGVHNSLLKKNDTGGTQIIYRGDDKFI
jgi:hypothetical protein